LGQVLSADNRLVEAEKVYQQSAEINEKLADEVPDQGYIANVIWHNGSLGWLRISLGRPQDAEKAYRKILATFEKLTPQYASDPALRSALAEAHARLGALAASAKKWREAEGAYRRAVTLYQKLIGNVPGEARYRSALAGTYNNLAWLLATCDDLKSRDAKQAVELAKKAVALDPKAGINTLGVAFYRAGDWKESIVAMKKSMELGQGGNSFDWFFHAMAHWKLGNQEEARQWYEKAVQWMEKNSPKDEELRRFRVEAAELLGLEGKKN
jgi:tetratricopeptide (TPR) repeat protein